MAQVKYVKASNRVLASEGRSRVPHAPIADDAELRQSERICDCLHVQCTGFHRHVAHAALRKTVVSIIESNDRPMRQVLLEVGGDRHIVSQVT